MSYYARFEFIDGHFFRFDTRIYLDSQDHPDPDGKCVAAVVGKNPGSAYARSIGVWDRLDLRQDKLLPSVRHRFLAAYRDASKRVPDGAYVRVWNLFYLCDAKLNGACKKLKNCPNARQCGSERWEVPPILWAVWGGPDSRLNTLKGRFSVRNGQHAFFFCKHMSTIVERLAESGDFARHTQGLPAEAIVAHLSRCL